MKDVGLGLVSKTVLVTGGATGIGKETVKAFAAEGAKVVFTDIVDRHVQPTELLHDSLDEGGNLRLVGGRAPADANTSEGMSPLVHETTVEGYQGTLDLNLKATVLCMKHEVLAMLKQRGGVIANMTSLAGIRYARQTSVAYAAAKAAVAHLTRKTALDYAAQNIRVNCIAPGLTLTDTVKSSWSPEKRDAWAKQQHPMGRMIDPCEIAQAIVWICSDKAHGITGLIVPVDGGWAAR